MKTPIKVAVCQLDTRMGATRDNVALALRIAERAVAAGAGYLLFHENMVHEYPPNAADAAEPVRGAVTDRFAAFCSDHRVRLGFGMTMRAAPRPFNAAIFINARGKIAATYAKRSLVTRAAYETYMARLEGRPIDMTGHERLLEDEVFQPGTADLVFDWDGIRAGVLICADTGRDDYWATLAARRAAVLFCPFNNPGLRLYHPRIFDQIKALGGYFVGANRAGSYPMGLPGRGQSFVADPMGNVIADCGGGVNTFAVADLSLDADGRP
ncbi:MAG: carbon-nitrogen hydrolase family protein [Armatimonadota bacterium]|nr:MAG: carbon-nitrogen hydrolase family protein [Armatimonadota bacterium]